MLPALRVTICSTKRKANTLPEAPQDLIAAACCCQLHLCDVGSVRLGARLLQRPGSPDSDLHMDSSRVTWCGRADGPNDAVHTNT